MLGLMITNSPSLIKAIESIDGPGCRIADRKRISGGDINRCFKLTLSSGRMLFLKENRSSLVHMFAAESTGLLALVNAAKKINGISVPNPLAWGLDGGCSFLLMEYINQGRLKSGTSFGASLAELHRCARNDSCGFEEDNWIGSTPQLNNLTASWHVFYAEYRLGFQWKLARKNGFGNLTADRAMERIQSNISNILPASEGPSLLHGDLWGGNWMAGIKGCAWLIDPAVYYGHREADIAMTELFGGFPSGFRDAYQDTWPLDPGFSERKNLYNLYHLLNHLNLFGLSYWPSVMSSINRYS